MSSPPKKYRVYRNLHTGGWSVKAGGRVVMRVDASDTLILLSPRAEVSAAGARRCLREGQRNVHAYLATTNPPIVIAGRVEAQGKSITYHPPHVSGLGWHHKEDKTPFLGASKAVLLDGKTVLVE